MKTESLCGEWQFRAVSPLGNRISLDWMSATVPGGVHTDLLAAGKIPDPFVADHELDVQWVAQSDWEYQRVFSVSPALLQEEKVYLVCDGLDTLADLSINGTAVGRAENMFRQYRFEVGSLLRDGENEVRIYFRSPVMYASERNAVEPMIGVSQAIPGGPYLRKAPCQFGWDWGPMLPPIGIWKDIRLEGFTNCQLENVHFRQIHSEGSVSIQAHFEVQNWFGGSIKAQLSVTEPNGVETYSSESILRHKGVVSVEVPNPKLWWPNSFGEQPLYSVSLALLCDNETMDSRWVKIGLRKLDLRQVPDEWGTSFTFVINEIPIFAKGSNWIPADSFPTRLTDEKLRHLMESAVNSHQNMLRVWGGGFYEEERFYDLCDELGILVWQDMVFSCSIYPLGEENFLANIKHEVEQNVARLRHRASLALWCGNNEMELGWESWGWQNQASEYREHYDQFFHQILPAWIAASDPDRPYWPSSPSSNTPFVNVNGQDVGDAHYWDVWHGRKPFTAYRSQYPRFMSEFGFQSLPPFETVKTYASESDWNMTSYIMEHHQRSGSGNGLMISQMTDTFRMPKNFSSLVYLSMVLQAEGIRFGVEHWRRNKHRVSGTLYWQLNDCWPVASWSSIDYFGRWKALHYAARRFFAPLLLSIADQGDLIDVHVTSDINQKWSGTLRWKLMLLTGKVLLDGEQAVELAPLASRQVFSRDFNLEEKDRRKVVFVCELFEGESPSSLNFLASSVATFSPNKHLELEKPEFELSVSIDGFHVLLHLQTDKLARFVELSLPEDVIFSDNYFDLVPGSPREISFTLPNGMSAENLKRRIKICSLYDSFA
jgi:beta-mannosidase